MKIEPTRESLQETNIQDGSVAMRAGSYIAAPIRTTPVLVIVLTSYLMIVLDTLIVITALPKMQQELGFSATELSWIQNAYTLAFGGLLLLGARAGDILGRRRIFIAGIALFTASSLAIGLTQSHTFLLTARALQGIGAALLAPSTLALLTANFPEGPKRIRAVAYYGAIPGVGTSLGLVLGGLLTDLLSWRMGFFINVPIGIAIMIAAPRYLAETERRPGRFDLAGAVSSTVGMTALVYGIVRSADAGWGDPFSIAALTTGGLLLVFFVFNEWHAQQPIMPLRLFANRERTGGYTARMLFLGGLLGFWFFTTQYLQEVDGYSPLEAGIAFLPMTLANFAVALAVPRLTQRFGNARLLASGITLTVIGMAWLSRISADTPFLTGIALPMILLGLGQGASLSPLTACGLVDVAAEDAGAASGLVNVSQQLGGALGLGILVTVFAATSSASLDARNLLAQRIATSLTASTIMIVLALALVIALIVRSPNSQKEDHGHPIDR